MAMLTKLIFILAIALMSSTAEAARLALVIGNDGYQHVDKLQNARSDARALAAALTSAGFAVTLRLDVDQPGFKAALRDFKEQIRGGEEVLFFFSGHGVQINAANYLLPVDIQGDKEDQVLDDAIPLQKVLDNFETQKAKFSLAIIDACRDNPFKAAGKKSIGGMRGLNVTQAATGQMVMFSAGAGQQALDRLGANDRAPNGLFTRVLLQEMQKPGVPVDQVLRNVREQVVQLARSVNHEQVPALYDQVVGRYYLVASLEPVTVPRTIETPVVAAHAKTKEQIEDDYWGEIKDSNDISSYEQYRRDYPKGRYLNIANLKLAQLKKQVQPPAPPVAVRENPETALWGEVQKGKSVEEYRAYLAQYPKGKYAELARGRLTKLETEAAAQAAIERIRQRQEAAQQEAAQQEATRPAPVAQKASQSIEIEMVDIPAGSFEMGCDNGFMGTEVGSRDKSCEGSGKPVHMVNINTFSIARSEVSQGQWQAVMGNNPSKFKDCGDNCPVENVSWNDIQTFIQKLNAQTGKTYRLPSEAEWEYACRAGKDTNFCGGNDVNAVAWYDGNSGNKTHPVGSKEANAWGVYDMSGNVEEWVQDGYHLEYKGAPSDGSVWDSVMETHVLRGGVWSSEPKWVRAAYRVAGYSSQRDDNHGFRLARTLP